MAITKESKRSIVSKILFLYFLVFPFGQLARVNISNISIPIIDIMLLFGIPLSLILPKLTVPQHLQRVVYVCLFTWGLNFAFLGSESVYGLLYLVRLVGIFSLIPIVRFFIQENGSNNAEVSRELIFKSLLSVCLMIAVLGFIQYFFLSDIRAFTAWNWDDHLSRLASTFFDPGFTSIILVFGYIISILLWQRESKRRYIFFAVMFLIALLLTYSRAGYIAFTVSNIVLLPQKFRKIFVVGFCILMLIFFLSQRGVGEGVNLFRTASIVKRFDNYYESIQIVKASPVFGIGYNNLCLVKKNIFLSTVGFRDTRIRLTSIGEHSCSGLDSSLLTILTTTGIVGFAVFIKLIYFMVKSVRDDIYGRAFIVSGVALLVHSIFVNSMLYVWVMGFMMILCTLASNGSKKKTVLV